jgi:hypothetical protein
MLNGSVLFYPRIAAGLYERLIVFQLSREIGNKSGGSGYRLQGVDPTLEKRDTVP